MQLFGTVYFSVHEMPNSRAAETLTFLILDLSKAVVCLKQLGGKVQGVEARQGSTLAQLSTASGSRYKARRKVQGKARHQGIKARWHANSVFDMLIFISLLPISSAATIQQEYVISLSLSILYP